MLPARNESEATLRVREVLCSHLSELIAGAVLETALRRSGHAAWALRTADIPFLLEALEHGSLLFLGNPAKVASLMQELSRLGGPRPPSRPAETAPVRSLASEIGRRPEERGHISGAYPIARIAPRPPEATPKAPEAVPRPTERPDGPLPTAALLTRLLVRSEGDIVVARGAARQAAEQLGVSLGFQTLVAAVVSELSRNLVRYAGGGDLELTALAPPHRGLEIVARDRGPGVAEQVHALQGGRDAALRGIERVASYVHVQTTPGRGTLVCVQVRER
jgi:serine/threonine-protein kinase RsbT